MPGEEEKKVVGDGSAVEMEEEEKGDDAAFVAVGAFVQDQLMVAVEEARKAKKLESQLNSNESE